MSWIVEEGEWERELQKQSRLCDRTQQNNCNRSAFAEEHQTENSDLSVTETLERWVRGAKMRPHLTRCHRHHPDRHVMKYYNDWNKMTPR